MKCFVFASVAMACVLTACGGGGGNNETNKASFSAVKVVGASLADSGTFSYPSYGVTNLKFTVQSGGSTTYNVYSERVAAAYGKTLCNFFASSTGGSSWTTNSGCTNYAVAGSAINYGRVNGSYVFTAINSAPTNQIYQLGVAAANGFSSGDLLIVGEGSSNDTATLITGYLTDVNSSGATTVFKQIINSLMNDNGVTAGAGVGASDGGLSAGNAYMTKLAQTLAAAIKSSALDHGVTHVVAVNTLDITRTPRLERVLAQVAAHTNQSTADQLRAIFQAWIGTYNNALTTALAPYSDRVVIVDLHAGFNAELNNMTQYGLTNTTSTVCYQTFNAAGYTKTGTDTTVAPGSIAFSDTDVSYPVFLACKDTMASAITPTTGETTSNWWRTYLFADNFHPTPYGHQLLAQLVTDRLAKAGWL